MMRSRHSTVGREAEQALQPGEQLLTVKQLASELVIKADLILRSSLFPRSTYWQRIRELRVSQPPLL